MITTKRFDYVDISEIQFHPSLPNHRELNLSKVKHYEDDIKVNGLLEPLVVWEKAHREFFLIGGYHRIHAIYNIRKSNPGFFDRVDVRVVAGEVDEMRALNLKLNADRVDTKITDFFDTIIYLNNANWEKARIAEFIDKSESWVDDILRYVPILPKEIRKAIEEDKISWSKAKQICRNLQKAKPGEEEKVLSYALFDINNPKKEQPKAKKPLTLKSAKKRLLKNVESGDKNTVEVSQMDLLCLLVVIEGKEFDNKHIERVQKKFPGLLDLSKAKKKDDSEEQELALDI